MRFVHIFNMNSSYRTAFLRCLLFVPIYSGIRSRTELKNLFDFQKHQSFSSRFLQNSTVSVKSYPELKELIEKFLVEQEISQWINLNGFLKNYNINSLAKFIESFPEMLTCVYAFLLWKFCFPRIMQEICTFPSRFFLRMINEKWSLKCLFPSNFQRKFMFFNKEYFCYRDQHSG